MGAYVKVYSDELAHHGIKGQKWGVRRFQNKDGTRTAAGKKRYSDTDSSKNENEEYSNANQKKNLTDKQKKILITGAIATATALAVVGGMYLYKKENKIPIHVRTISLDKLDIDSLSDKEMTLSKGTKFHRISSKSVEDYAEEGKRIYVSYLKEDARLYKATMPEYLREWGKKGIISDNGRKTYEHVLTSKNEIKVPSDKLVAELFLKITNKDSVKGYEYANFMRDLNDSDNRVTKEFFKQVRDLGYNAVIDGNDAGNFTKSPLILLNPKDDIISSSSHRLRALEKIMNVVMM